MQATIGYNDVRDVAGPDLEPGMVTVQGIVTQVWDDRMDGAAWFEAGGQNVYLEPGREALVLGRVTDAILDAVRTAMAKAQVDRG